MMWAMAELVRKEERERWRKLKGTEFTGMDEGRRVRLRWYERTVGHICVGDAMLFGHLKCHRIVQMDWVFVREAKP